MSEELSKEEMDKFFTTEELMKTITPEKYIEYASNTDVDTNEYDEQRQRLTQYKTVEELCFVLSEIINIGKRLDNLKKHVYYGNEVKFQGQRPSEDTEKNIFRASGALNDNEMTHIAHGIIGKTTESIELCEALFHHIYNGKKFDKVNVVEEIGDGQWYDALLLRVLKVPFAKAWSINIAKLYKRFEGKFSKEKALNRNLKTERKVLEG